MTRRLPEAEKDRLPVATRSECGQFEKLSTASGCICLRIARAEESAITRAHRRLGGIVGRDRAVVLPV